MKKHYFIFSLITLCVMLGVTSTRAEIVTQAPYTEDFEDLITTPTKDFVPPKWGRIVDYLQAADWSSSDTYVEYTYSSTEGVDNTGYLKAGSQNLSNWDGDSKTASDLLITPAVTGEVSFYLKNSSSSDADVKIYTCNKDEATGKYTQDELYKEITSEAISTNWVKFTLSNVPADTYLGFRLDNASIDLFTASSAKIEKKRSLELTKTTYKGVSSPACNPEGKITFTAEVQITNTGDIAFNPNDEGYSLSIIEQYNPETILATQNIEVALAPGATTTIEISQEITPWEGHKRYDIKENVSGTSTYCTWLEPIPYVPNLVLCLPNDGSELKAAIAFGLIKEPVTKELRIRNTGGAPLVITKVDLPEGYTTDLSLPLTIASKSEQLFNLTLGTESTGNKSGDITFTADNMEPKSYALTGLVLSADNYYENFETGKQPGNMLFGESWGINSESGNTGNRYWAQHGSRGEESKTFMITPLLTVKDGESLVFFAAKRYTYNDSFLNVYYSSDRQEWTSVKAIKAGYTDDDNTFSNEEESGIANYVRYAFKQFTIDDIPAGNYYIGFEAGCVAIDDIFGYRLAAVEHDMYITASQLQRTGTVNYPYTATLTASNLNSKAESAGSYTPTLYFNDEAVATAEASEWAAAESKTFEFAFTPHTAGTFSAYIELAAGEYKVKTAVTEVTIAKEQASEEIQVGTITSANNSNAPFSMNWKNSETETIYTAETLGLTEGAKIISLTYDGYCDRNTDVDFNIRVWLDNTEDGLYSGTFAPKDTLDMTLVYTGTHKIDVQGSSSAMVPLLNLQLTEPFVYTGGNLRVLTMSKANGYKTVNFASVSTPNTAYYYRNDNPYDRTTASWSSSSYMPCVRIGIEKEVMSISGKVAGKEGEPIANAVVKLTAGDVIYAGTTAEDGTYNIDVFQTEKEYTLTVDKQGYNTFTEEGVSLEAGSIEDKNITLTESQSTGIGQTEADAVVIISKEELVRILTPADGEAQVYNLSGMLIHRQALTAGSNEMTLAAGSYIMLVDGRAHKVIVK